MTKRGADVTAIGTGGRRMAQAFVEDEQIPFRVLLDEDGSAATIVGVKKMSASTALDVGQWKSATRALTAGHRPRKTGRRPFQLGGTLVVGPGDELRLADLEDHAGDHTDLEEILAVI